MQLLIIVVLIIASVFMLSLGGLIWRFQMTEIMSGYDPAKVKDNAGLSKMVGGNLMIIGIIGLLIVLVGMIIDLDSWLWPIAGFVCVMLFFCIRIVLADKRYETHDE